MNWYKKAQNNPAPFLETPESAWEWVKNNVDIDIKYVDVDMENISNYDKSLLNEYMEKSEMYSDRYHRVKDEKTITIYRAIRIKTLNDINWDKIGTHWSFERRGAGVYANTLLNTKDVVLTGIIEPKYIDWPYCFTSFIYYGTDQWECALKYGSPVQITHIDNTPVNIKAKA